LDRTSLVDVEIIAFNFTLTLALNMFTYVRLQTYHLIFILKH